MEKMTPTLGPDLWPAPFPSRRVPLNIPPSQSHGARQEQNFKAEEGPFSTLQARSAAFQAGLESGRRRGHSTGVAGGRRIGPLDRFYVSAHPLVIGQIEMVGIPGLGSEPIEGFGVVPADELDRVGKPIPTGPRTAGFVLKTLPGPVQGLAVAERRRRAWTGNKSPDAAPRRTGSGLKSRLVTHYGHLQGLPDPILLRHPGRVPIPGGTALEDLTNISGGQAGLQTRAPNKKPDQGPTKSPDPQAVGPAQATPRPTQSFPQRPAAGASEAASRALGGSTGPRLPGRTSPRLPRRTPSPRSAAHRPFSSLRWSHCRGSSISKLKST